MCGFTITKEKIDNKISHRGVSINEIKTDNWDIVFNSLPLCTYGTNIEQPLKIGSFILCFNGEIFNYKELDPRAKSDLEYLSNFMKRKNSPSLLFKESLKWDGFWSIALVKNNKIYFFTDKLGKKQLYYNSEGLSSEIKSFNDKGEYHEYKEKHFGTFNTNFGNVNRALPGVLYIYDRRNDLATRLDYLEHLYGDSNSSLYDIIDKSVKDRLENKYDGVSLLLSGGLDSNIVLHHALKYTDDIDIVSIENDEKENVLKLQDHYNLDINYIKDDYSQQDIESAVYHYEHSLDYGSLIPNYLLFKSCKHSLVLTGDGADEFFSGYKRSEKEDTWRYDVFKELPYFHNIRLDRMSMMFTKEARSPLMSSSLLNFSKKVKWKDRINKKILREAYRGILPDYVIDGEKKPLRLDNDKDKNRDLIEKIHYNIYK